VYAPLIVLLSVFILNESLTLGFVVGGLLVVGGVTAASCEPMGRHAGTGTAATARERRAGIVTGVLGVVFMAVGIVIVKPVLERGHLVEVTLIRFVAGVLGQFVWIAAVRSERSALSVWRPGRVWLTLLPAAFLGSYVSMLLWLGGFKWADASTASVLNQMATVFTIMLARVILKEKLTPPRVIGALAAVGGALMVLVL
jgi:drug/metabolite transporter (DMT)-like permease